MTHFAQLGGMEKSAGTAPQQYQQGPTGLNDVWPGQASPGAPQVPQPGGGWDRWDTGEVVADLGLGWNPWTGVPWYGGKAIYQQGLGMADAGRAVGSAVRGDWDGAWDSGKQSLGHMGNYLSNLGFGALSFIGGGGAASAALKGGKIGMKTIPTLFKAGPKAWMVGKTLPKGVRAGLGVGGAALGFGAGPAINWMTGQSGAGQPQIPESYTPQPGAMSLPEQMSRSLIQNKPV